MSFFKWDSNPAFTNMSPEECREMHCNHQNKLVDELYEKGDRYVRVVAPRWRMPEAHAEMEKLGYQVSYIDGEDYEYWMEKGTIQNISVNELDPQPPKVPEDYDIRNFDGTFDDDEAF